MYRSTGAMSCDQLIRGSETDISAVRIPDSCRHPATETSQQHGPLQYGGGGESDVVTREEATNLTMDLRVRYGDKLYE